MTSSNQSYDRDSRLARQSFVARSRSRAVVVVVVVVASTSVASWVHRVASRAVVERARRRVGRRAHQRVVERAVAGAVAGAGEALEQGPEPFVRHVRNIRRRSRAARSIAIRVREPRVEGRERRANLVASVDRDRSRSIARRAIGAT